MNTVIHSKADVALMSEKVIFFAIRRMKDANLRYKINLAS